MAGQIPENFLANSKVIRGFQTFFSHSTTGGIMLILATIVAMLWANLDYDSYYGLWHTGINISLGDYSLFGYFEEGHGPFTLHTLINDAIMVIFFFFVGLEIKREILVGELSSIKNSMLPILGALGGVIFPALIYYGFNAGNEIGMKGWAIPMATDIAFALGVLMLVGKNVPTSLKVFLAALAIVDDLIAVLVIAVFYTDHLSFVWLFGGFGFLAVMYIGNRLHIIQSAFYLLFGLGVWYCFLMSGVHATIAGVLGALMIPTTPLIKKQAFWSKTNQLWKMFTANMDRTRDDHLSDEQSDVLSTIEYGITRVVSPLRRIEHGLDYPVAFVILPIFALANAGVNLSGFGVGNLVDPVTLGIVFGLFFGKIIGVTAFSWIAVKAKIANLPAGATWPKILAVSLLCGIGFTMAMFVAGLAFKSNSPADVAALMDAKVGILLASLIAGISGYIILKRAVAKMDDTISPENS
ncbi:MAG: sodium/proton antiporter NhaA [Candidatus Kapaibacteriales bacterium]